MAPKSSQSQENWEDTLKGVTKPENPNKTGKTTTRPANQEDKSQAKDGRSNNQANGSAGKSRHTACSVCRERKIRCDGAQPSCSRCIRLGHQCSYMVARRNNSGDKHQFSHALETLDARLGTSILSSYLN